MDSRDGSGNKKTGEHGKESRGSGFTILFVNEGTERVRSIRTTKGVLILTVFLVAALAVGIIGYIVHGAFVRGGYDARIDSLNKEIAELTEENKLLENEIKELKVTGD